jgi:transketolase
MLSAKALALRASVVAMVKRVRVGYLLQGLGAADIFATLFFSELRLRADDPEWDGRDPIPAKFSAFGWQAEEVDGNDRDALVDVFARARATKHKPYLISAVTKPGAGIPFFEGQMSHVALLSPEDADRALAYLQGTRR